MLPPVDEAVLQQNPDFANLYGKLTKVILNPDGSTREDPEANTRAAVREELDKHRLKTAKQHLLTRAISTASPSDPKPPLRTAATSRPRSQTTLTNVPVPEPLIDLLLILPALLSPGTETALPPDSLDLLFSHPPLSNLEDLIPELTPLLSASLRSSALSLTRLTRPTTNPSFLHRHIASLPRALATLRADVAAAEAGLAAQRFRTLASLGPLLRAYTQAMAHLMRALEAKHGVIARSLELGASEVALQAQRHEVEAQQTLYAVRGEVYTPEVVAALKSYAVHLRDAKVRGEERIRGLKAELGDFGVGVEGGEGKEKMMREMARVYREMGRQMDDVNSDLERLQHGLSYR